MRDEGAMSHALSGFLGLLIAVVFSATSLLAYNQFQGIGSEAPRAFSFVPDEGEAAIRVVASPPRVLWTEIDVRGCTLVPEGEIQAGQEIRGCSGDVLIRDALTDRILFQSQFAAA